MDDNTSYSDQPDYGNRKKLIIVIVAAALVVAAAAVGGFVLYRRSQVADGLPAAPAASEDLNSGVTVIGGEQDVPATEGGQADPGSETDSDYRPPAANSAFDPSKIEIGVVQEMTPEQKQSLNLPADQKVEYKYVAPDPASGMKAPVLLIIDHSAPPPPDSDKDGMSDSDEKAAGTDPSRSDTDGDGISDSSEILLKTNPLDKSSIPASKK